MHLALSLIFSEIFPADLAIRAQELICASPIFFQDSSARTYLLARSQLLDGTEYHGSHTLMENTMWQIEPIAADTGAAESVRWLWANVLPRGTLVVLDGDPECGKSMLTVDLAARLSRGADWPDGSPGGPPGTAILFAAEDSKKRVVRPRLLAAGADATRVYVFGCPDSPEPPPKLPRDLPELTALIELVRPDLLVLDQLLYFLSGGVSASIVPSVLAKLAELAARFDVTIVLVRHLTKRQGLKAIYRGLGAIGVIGAARAGLLVARDPADASRFVLTAVKSNLVPHASALGYRVVTGSCAAVVEWLGAVDVTAEEAALGTRREPGGNLHAEQWLARVLSSGEVLVSEILRQAKEAGISERTLDRAKAKLHVQSRLIRVGKGGQWAWSMTGRFGRIVKLSELPKIDEEEKW
jgi:AAA domain